MKITPTYQILNGQRLTEREAQVLLCCAYGYTMQQTANRLNMAYKTVDTNHSRIRQKFDLKGYHALAHFALKIQADLEAWLGTNLRPS